MLRLVDRNKVTGLDIFKRLDRYGNCLGYVVGTANMGRMVTMAGGSPMLSIAREIAGKVYNPPAKETVSESVHAANQISARMKKPGKGKK